MTTTIFNLEQLRKVEIKDKRKCSYFKYKEYYKHWLWGTRKEGFWEDDTHGPWTKEQLEAGVRYSEFIVEDRTVYYLPNVTLYFSGKGSYNKQFKTYAEALEWGSAQAGRGITVKLIIEE